MENAAKIIRKSYKFRIYPSKSQIVKLETTLDLCRELYNAALQERRDAWQLEKKSISYYDQSAQVSEIRRIREEFSHISYDVLRYPLRNLDKAFKAFFSRIKKQEKAGYPRFKSASRFNSLCFSKGAFWLRDGKVEFSKLGKFKIKLSRPVIGKAKTCTIKREADKWFAIFSVETLSEPLPKTGKQIGIDVGIENFATLSDGTQIENFNFFQSTQKKLRVAQRRVARRKKSSNGRRNAVLQLRKVHLKIKNQRADFQHKISTKLVRDFDLIAVEKLNVLGMSKSILAKQINDVAWGNFFQMLTYKAENAGRQLVKVNPNGTSQICICGETVKKTLAVRLHKCDKCGYENHRDIVSAQVILQRAGLVLEDVTYVVAQSVSLESQSKPI